MNNNPKQPRRVKNFSVEIWVRFDCPQCRRRVGFQSPKTNHTSSLVHCQCGEPYTIRDGITDLDVGVFFGDAREDAEPALAPDVSHLPPMPIGDNEHENKLK